MSSEQPPNPIVNTFNPEYWRITADDGITTQFLDANYLKFPLSQNAQETFVSIPNISATMPPSTDNTNKIPTTAWVQSAIGAGSVPNLNSVLSTGNTATGAYANINLVDTDVGGQANPILNLQNTNATGSVALEVYKNKPTAGTAGDVLFNQSVYGKDSGNAKQEYTRISHTLRDATGGGEDGSMEFSCFVNGAVATFLQLNGNENELNCLKVLDMGGNNIRTTAGNITLDGTSAPNGVGDINLNPRATAVCNVNGNFRIPSTSNNLVIGTAGSGFNGLMSSQGTLFTDTAGGRTAFTSAYNGLELTDTPNAVSSSLTQTQLTMTDIANPANNITLSATPTGIGFVRNDTGSGTQQNFSFNNDSASGGTINYTNTIGSNGIVISTNQSIELSSVAGLFFLTGLPTSVGGLPTGALWNNSGVLSIV